MHITGEVLCLILDIDPRNLNSRNEDQERSLSWNIRNILQPAMIFLKSFLSLQEDNYLCVIQSHPYVSQFVYFSKDLSGDFDENIRSADQKGYSPFVRLENRLLDSLIEGIKPKIGSYGGLTKSIGRALCFINRISSLRSAEGEIPSSGTEFDLHGKLASSEITSERAAHVKNPTRILIISDSKHDSSIPYVSVMNCMFAAQKKNVAIDVCHLNDKSDANSSGNISSPIFLKQLSYMTNGVFSEVSDPRQLLQNLLMSFTVGRPIDRAILKLPRPQNVDLRATCFCHGKSVDIGHVCSICLSIFCNPSFESCMICGSKFEK